MSAGIILFAHGSRIAAANDGVRAAAAELARAGGFEHVEAAFLELGQPDLTAAVQSLTGRGVRQIVVVPYFLTPGLHLERDLPSLIHGISTNQRDLEIVVTPPLDGHPALIQILLDRVRDAVG